MIDRKKTRARGDSKGNERKAEEAERAWRASSLEAATLPPAEPQATRAERRALLELQLGSDNEDVQQQAVKQLRIERNKAKEAERLRPRRKRPNRHLPAGLTLAYVTLVSREAGKLPEIQFCEKDTPGAQILITQPASYQTLEEVTPDLARDAAALRAAFDVERMPIMTPPVVLQEIAVAIRLAAAAVREVWISIALTLVHQALVHLHTKAHGGLDSYELRGRPAPQTTPEAIYEAVVGECVQWVALPPPSDVHAGTISWMLGHLAVGVTRGGGKTKKLSAANMRAILTDEKKRTRIAAKPV